MSSTIILGLGTNMGDRFSNLRTAIERLTLLLGELSFSSVYESPALLKEDSPPEWNRPYLNMAVKAVHKMHPADLLGSLKTIERDMGRKVDAPCWSPRTIDIDILCHGGTVIHSPALNLPHPHLSERAFVLMPFLEIAPEWKHPETNQTLLQMLSAMPITGTERIGAFA